MTFGTASGRGDRVTFARMEAESTPQMKKPDMRRSDPDSLSERLGRIRRALFLLESGERLKYLRESSLPKPSR
jgi:hypothetical protein